MAAYRNAFLAVVSTALLVGGLIFLFPSPSQAALVHFTSGGVGALDSNDDFDVTFSVEIPDGEHIPLDHVEVLVTPADRGIDGSGLLQAPYTCHASSASSTATILSVMGAQRVEASLNGYGYDVQPSGSGYGYDFTNPSSIFSGTGYGYGYGDAGDVTVTLTVRVSGCTLAFDGDGRADVRLQALVGTTTEQLKSFPVTTTFFDPGTVDTANTGTAGQTLTEERVSRSGDQTTTEILVTMDPGSGAKSVAGGETVVFDPSDGDLSGFTRLAFTTNKALPQGSRITATLVSDETPGPGPSRSAPPFGISPSALSAQTPHDPAFVLQIKLFVPGEGEVDPADYLSQVQFTIDVSQSYFSNVGRAVSTFAVRGFTEAGDLKSTHPTIVSRTATGVPPTVHSITFRITDHSSFVGLVGHVGGGGSTPSPSPEPSVTEVPPVTPPVTPPVVPPVDLDTDDDGFPDTVEVLLGSDPLDGSSRPDVRVSTQADRDGTTVRVTWDAPPEGVDVEGFQVWRSTGGPWTLLATLEGGHHREHVDDDPPQRPVYQVTFFLSRETGHGFVDGGQDPREGFAHFNAEGEGAAPAEQETPQETPSLLPGLSRNQWWAVTALVVLLAAALAIVGASLLRRREHP